MIRMSTRLKLNKVFPDAYKAMSGLESLSKSSELHPLHKKLIKIRASQINGCAFCVNMHTAEAREVGETDQRMHLISVWREAPNVFSEEERLILAITEEVTLIHRHGLSDELYEKAVNVFGESITAQIIMNIVTINSWNRISVSLRTEPVLQNELA
jgi:AhpD family alkylhydroperoxidase